MGVNGIALFGQMNTMSGIGGIASFNSTFIGKESRFTKSQVSLNYTTNINFKHNLSFGLGFKLFSNIYDESKLLTDLDLSTFNYSYGVELQKEKSYQIPIGVSFTNKNTSLGAYFSKGVSTEDAYGVYAKTLGFETEVKGYKVKDFVALSMDKAFLNSRVTLANEVKVDNYKLDVFYSYNFSSSSLRSYQTFGAAIYYHWHIFNVNYQLAVNNNRLGLSHQVGFQIYID